MKEDLDKYFCWGGFIETVFIAKNKDQATFYDLEINYKLTPNTFIKGVGVIKIKSLRPL